MLSSGYITADSKQIFNPAGRKGKAKFPVDAVRTIFPNAAPSKRLKAEW
jgi:hypothetical protein